MEIPAEQSQNATEVAATQIGKRKLRTVRCRMVQSTLLPHNPQVEEEKNGGDQVEENNCGEQEELCGSQGKKKRKTKGKTTTPQSRSSKSNKVK